MRSTGTGNRHYPKDRKDKTREPRKRPRHSKRKRIAGRHWPSYTRRRKVSVQLGRLVAYSRVEETRLTANDLEVVGIEDEGRSSARSRFPGGWLTSLAVLIWRWWMGP